MAITCSLEHEGFSSRGKVMNWGEWVDRAPGAALAQWKLAASGVSRMFDAPAGRRVRKEHAHEKEGAFWVEIRESLDGIRLIAVRLFRPGNTNGQIELCIFSYAQREDVWKRFEHGPNFTFNGVTFARYPRAPQGSWKYELEKEGTEVRGVAFSGKLADVFQPQVAGEMLPAIFKSFCAFVVDRCAASQADDVTAAVMATVPVGALNGTTKTSSADLAQMAEDEQIAQFEQTLVHLSASEREALVKTRVGQSSYREKLLQRWSNGCSVTGLKSPEVLIASHIVPWSHCESATERWDVDNGLLLTPGLDKAFELGYISFEHEGAHRGRIILSSKANWDLKDKLKLDNPQWRIREWYPRLTFYLARHRDRWCL